MEKKAKILRFPTLRIVDLLGTSIQSVRLEMVGPNSRSLVRLGTWLLYLPLMVVGYLFLVAALARWVAISFGWGVTLLLFGGVHLLVGSLGAVFGGTVGASGVHPVLEPRLDSPNSNTFVEAGGATALPPRPGSVGRTGAGQGAGSPSLPAFLTAARNSRVAEKKAAVPPPSPLSRPGA